MNYGVHRVSREEPAIKKLEEIQAFRGLAAILVVIYHTTVLSGSLSHAPYAGSLFSFGFAGVDFFFVLSGFIITLMHYNDIGDRAVLGPYLRKRFLRIYPIYWIITLSILPVYFAISGFGAGFETEPRSIFASLILFPQDHYPILGVAWSLCHEVKFYLLFALAIALGRKAAAWMAAVVVAASGALYLLDLMGAKPGLPHLVNFLTSRYNLEFAAGCLCAYLATRRPPGRPHILRNAGFALFLGAAALNAFLMDLHENHSILTFGLASALLVVGSATAEFRSPKSLSAWLLFIGDASYSIYLTHYLALSAAFKALSGSGLMDMLGRSAAYTAMFAMAVGTGCLVHAFVEKPLLARLGRRSRGSRIREMARGNPGPTGAMPAAQGMAQGGGLRTAPADIDPRSGKGQWSA